MTGKGMEWNENVYMMITSAECVRENMGVIAEQRLADRNTARKSQNKHRNDAIQLRSERKMALIRQINQVGIGESTILGTLKG
jgi:hypothetical protein